MPEARVAIHLDPGAEAHFAVREYGNYRGQDTSPVTDATEIGVKLGDGVITYMTVGQWKALVATVFLGIEAIPVKREERLERERRCRDRAAQRDIAAVPA